jgi:4-amino-4-deoxy-L-arabinose transferase-like glycosyltransferase
MMPLWEGWDEYAHFAWLQHWNDHGTLPRIGDRISREIDESMRLAPLPLELRWIGPPYLTHADWWALPAEEREDRRKKLASLPPSLAHLPAQTMDRAPFTFYEAQQPPLYYWIAATVMRPAAQWPIRERVLLIRLFDVLLVSLAIPFTFLAARLMFGASAQDHGAIFAAALLAVAPGFAINAARVANDSLAIALAALFLWLVAREKTKWPLAGIVLGGAILAKASLLALAPVLIVLWVRRRWKDAGLALALAFLLGGWWYVRNALLGEPVTGWLESVPAGVLAASALKLSWIGAAQIIAKSFTWFGGWSFLTLRSWMYTVLEAFACAGMLGSLARRKLNLRAPNAFVIWFAVAMAGGAAAYNAVQGTPGIPGWYLWPACGALAILITAGLGRFSIAFAAMLAAADLFGGAARMMPYYAGLAPWNHGSLVQVVTAAGRLHLNGWMVFAWALGTLAVPLLLLPLFQRRAKTRM